VSIPNSVTRDAKGNAISVVAYAHGRDVPLLVADNKHPHFEAILSRLVAGDTSVFELFDVGTGIIKKFGQVTERVSFNGSEILFDGEPIHSTLTAQLQRALDAGLDDYKPLALFWEKLESNPNAHSRQQAYDFLAAHDFKITPEGDVIGYKGYYRNDKGASTAYRSSHASQVAGKASAWINGLPLPERVVVNQSLGDVVTLPRNEVVHDPSQYCNRGLHVGTFDYASSYGNVTVEVHFNPRDLVSVPNDARGEKIRVCRYKNIVEVTSERQGGPVLAHDDTESYNPKADVGARVF
jgi:hypothetical protein